jgi:hypothetical protein
MMRIMMSVLVVGILVYLGVTFVRGWNESLVTTTAYSATVSVGLEATGMVIREETVITGSGSYVDLVPNEGEKVSGGQTVAILYSDSSGLDTRQEAKTLSAEIEQLQYALSSGTDTTDTSKLDASVLQSIANLRALSVSDDLTGLEDSALNLRTMVFKRDYTYGDSGVATGIAALIESKQAELASLQSSLSRVSTSVYSPASGVFSGVADGYEQLLTPDSVRTLTPSGLTALMNQDTSASANAVGKLITSSTWYFAAVMDEADTEGLLLEQTYTITFSHDWFGDVEMTLEWLSDKEDGKVIALFSARTHLADITLLREQTVDIVTQQLEGIRVPRRSLRVITETTTDKDTGEEIQTQYTGVFTVVGTQAELQKVNVLYTDDNFYLVEPVDGAATKRLRAGDDVIVNSTGLFDGKVVR